MKTAEQPRIYIRENEKNAMVIRLERVQKDLIQLRGQLRSYRCEPKTYSLFEYVETLKRGMDRLSISNIEVIDRLKNPRNSISNHFEKAKQQFSKFEQLKDGVADYRTKCLNR